MLAFTSYCTIRTHVERRTKKILSFWIIMIKNILHNIKIYKALVRYNFIRELEFRINFTLGSLIYFSWAVISFFSIELIYRQTTYVGSWDKNSMLLLTLVFFLSNGLYKTIFHRGLNDIPQLIRKGDLDFIFLKPVNTRFFISMKSLLFDNLPRLVIFILLIFRYVKITNPTATLLNYVLAFLIQMFGILAMYNVIFCISCISFWKPRVWNLFSLTNQIRGLANYPSDIYRGFLRAFVIILPIAAFSTIPTKFLLGEGSLLLGALSIVIFIITTILSMVIWKAGLVQYESASS